MSDVRRHAGPVEREWVAQCLRDVNAARARLLAARHTAERGWNKHTLRAELLVALEGYAAAITQLGAPIPGRLHSEIELYRRLKNRP